MSAAPRRRPDIGDDAGFTLVELLMTIVVLGIIAAPLGGVVLTYLKNTDATTARMSESHDALLAASYFAQDVQAVGLRGAYTSTAEPALLPSVTTGVAAPGGCGPAGTPAAVGLAWDDFADSGVASRTQVHVTYVVVGSELHRVVCRGTAAPVQNVVARNLVAPFTAVTCTDAAGNPMTCTDPAVPDRVELALTIQDAGNGTGTPYEVTLTGQRRQT